MKFISPAQFTRLALEVRAIGKGSLSRRARSQAARTWIRLNLFPDKGIPNPVQLFGHRISYFRTRPLRLLFREIILEECYFFHAETRSPVIFDCGSNIGMSIVYFKTLYPAARIIAFEPDPIAFDKLSENVTHNSLADVTLHNCALSDKEGELEFYRNDDHSLRMSLYRQRMDGQKITVAARRLSSFLNEEIDLLKMDIEGAEGAVMRDLAASGRLRLVKQIHLEYHHHIDGNVDELSSMLKLLEDAGFGYQLSVGRRSWGQPRLFQDISVYCYRK